MFEVFVDHQLFRRLLTLKLAMLLLTQIQRNDIMLKLHMYHTQKV